VITWKQLKLIDKPIFVFNKNGYYDPILQLIDQASRAGFIRPDTEAYFQAHDTVDGLIDRVRAHFSHRLIHHNTTNSSYTDAATL